MDSEPGPGWADAVSKILKMGTMKPKKNKILSKARVDSERVGDGKTATSSSDKIASLASVKLKNTKLTYITKRLRADSDHLNNIEKDLKSIATGGVVQLFNAVKAVNPNADKKTKKKRKKKKKKTSRRR